MKPLNFLNLILDMHLYVVFDSKNMHVGIIKSRYV